MRRFRPPHLRYGSLLVSNGAGSLDATSDAIEDLEASAWVLSRGGFTGKHDGIRAFENGIGDIGDLGACR